MVLLSFDSLSFLKKQSNVKRGTSPYCKHTRVYICACLCTLSICSMFKQSEDKSQNVCRHQPLENDEHLVSKEQAKIPSVLLLLLLLSCIHIHHQSVVLLDQSIDIAIDRFVKPLIPQTCIKSRREKKNKFLSMIQSIKGILVAHR